MGWITGAEVERQRPLGSMLQPSFVGKVVTHRPLGSILHPSFIHPPVTNPQTALSTSGIPIPTEIPAG